MSKAMIRQNIADQCRKDIVGKRYRHFKGGIYEVIDLAVDTETEDIMVVYKDIEKPSLVWVRPFAAFLSRVDKDKYPRAKQEMRFEEIPAESAVKGKNKYGNRY